MAAFPLPPVGGALYVADGDGADGAEEAGADQTAQVSVDDDELEVEASVGQTVTVV